MFFLTQAQLSTGFISDQRERVHDYRSYEWGQDYTFVPIEDGTKGYIAGYGGYIRPGDFLILKNGMDNIRYYVEAVDRYTDPPDLWIALLKPCHGKVVDRRFWMGPAENSEQHS